MAFGTFQAGMRTGEREARFRVVKCRWQPGRGGVTLAAIRAELAVVRIVLGVAGAAARIKWRKDVIYMALRAFQCGMSASKGEFRFCMIEGSRNPAIGGMAGTAVSAQLSLVSIIFGVASIAVLRGRLEVIQAAGFGMAGGAVLLGMLAGQFKCDRIMAKSMAIGIHSVMASQAILAEGL